MASRKAIFACAFAATALLAVPFHISADDNDTSSPPAKKHTIFDMDGPESTPEPEAPVIKSTPTNPNNNPHRDPGTNDPTSSNKGPNTGHVTISAPDPYLVKHRRTGRTHVEPPSTPTPVAVPDSDLLAQAEKEVKEVFDREYHDHSPNAKYELSQKLFEKVDHVTNDPATQYVLLREIKDTAAEAGDANTALAAINQMAAYFTITNARDLKLAMLEVAAKHAASPWQYEAVARAYVDIVDAMLTNDEFDAAAKIAPQSSAAVIRANYAPLTAVSHTQNRLITVLAREYGKIKPALTTLKDKPDDPAANLAVGSFYCFYKEQWDNGLPMLAKSADPVLKPLAKKDLANPTDPKAASDLAEGWWSFADKQPDAVKVNAQGRAAKYYRLALPSTSGLAQLRVNKNIDTYNVAHNALRPRIVNLIALLDVDRDAMRGNWEIRNNKLVLPDNQEGQIELPYVPPEEYDFRIDFRRTQGHDAIEQLLSVPTTAFSWVIAADYDTICGFQLINGQQALSNPTTLKGRDCLVNGQGYTSIVKVRKDGVEAWVNGKLIARWKTNYADMAPPRHWAHHTARALGLAAYQSSVTFQRIEVVEIGSEGTILTARPDEDADKPKRPQNTESTDGASPPSDPQ